MKITKEKLPVEMIETAALELLINKINEIIAAVNSMEEKIMLMSKK